MYLGPEGDLPTKLQATSGTGSRTPKPGLHVPSCRSARHRCCNRPGETYSTPPCRTHTGNCAQTGGYPSLGIRGFLRMLSENPTMVAVPFYFLSDHDVYGFDMYQVLKFGAKGTAWSSPTLTRCSGLGLPGGSRDFCHQIRTNPPSPGTASKQSRRRSRCCGTGGTMARDNVDYATQQDGEESKA